MAPVKQRGRAHLRIWSVTPIQRKTFLSIPRIVHATRRRTKKVNYYIEPSQEVEQGNF